MKSLFFLLFLCSCTAIYQPAVLITPDIKEKGEAVIAGGGDLYLKSSGFAGNLEPGIFGYAAFSPVQRMYVGGSYSYLRVSKQIDLLSAHHSLSVFTGFYQTFGRDSLKLFEIIAGIGKGGGKEHYHDSDDYKQGEIISGNFRNIYVQPNLRFVNFKNILILSASLRLNYLHYDQINRMYVNWLDGTYIPRSYIAPTSVWYIEPGCTFKANLGNFSIYTQISLSIPPKLFRDKSNAYNADLDFHLLNAYGGIVFNFNNGLNLYKLIKKK